MTGYCLLWDGDETWTAYYYNGETRYFIGNLHSRNEAIARWKLADARFKQYKSDHYSAYMSLATQDKLPEEIASLP